MAQTTLSYKVQSHAVDAIRAALEADGYSFRDQQHMVFQARGPSATLSCYRSGSVVIQGAGAEALALRLGLISASSSTAADVAPPKPASSAKPRSSAAATGATTSTPLSTSVASTADGRLHDFEQWRATLCDPAPNAWIGIDEAGKGDFFGPLVIAAVRVTHEDLGWIAQLGVGDSKQLNDKNIRPMAAQLKKALPAHHVIRLMPERYNALYAKFGNLNRLLAWAHAACAENVLERAPAEVILSDQFSKEAIVPRYFKGPGKDCVYVQRTKAESDAAVACASVLARAEFLWGMHELSEQYGMTLHKGAGDPTIADARRFLARFGAEALEQSAKTHFKTMETIGAR